LDYKKKENLLTEDIFCRKKLSTKRAGKNKRGQGNEAERRRGETWPDSEPGRLGVKIRRSLTPLNREKELTGGRGKAGGPS